jgi:hypothetical protein
MIFINTEKYTWLSYFPYDKELFRLRRESWIALAEESAWAAGGLALAVVSEAGGAR